MSSAERLMYIVRHGATDWNQSGRIQGHIDIPLNETGRAQAHMVSRRLTAFGATALFSSDLLRAYETAQIIGQATGLRVTQNPGLREINFGVWQGLSSLQIRECDPEVYAARRANPYDVAPVGAETWRHFYARAVQAVLEILAVIEAERLIVVTHGGVCTALGLRALGFDCTGKRTFNSHNCGIHTIAVQGDTWRAIALNDITHLTADF
jgi:2,3-bisphosphoglycerate-dependent phosphoglycerate mutase